MSLFNRTPESQTMGQFILTEIRDLRKGMEGRDAELRGEIAAVRTAVTTLSESVARSQDTVNNLESSFQKVRADVDNLLSTTTADKVKAASAWDGPKKVFQVMGVLGAGVTALLVILKIEPVLAALFANLVAVAQ